MARRDKRLWTQSVILGGLLFGGYLIYNNLYKPYRDNSKHHDDTSNQENKKSSVSKKRTTKCVIVNGAVNEKIEWINLLSEPNNDVIVLVSPECKSQFQTIIRALPLQYCYKVIYCDTLEGVWSCVRSVRKSELYLMAGLMIPDDIRRYTNEIIMYDMNTTLI